MNIIEDVGASKTGLMRMLALSVLFHLGLFVLAAAAALKWQPRHPGAYVYQVDLVTLPQPEPAAHAAPVKETPPPEVKKPKESAPPKAAVKKPSAVRPEPAMKPIGPTAVVPPSVKSKETAVPKEPASETRPPAPPTAKPIESVAAIPAPETRVEAGVEIPDFKYPYYLDLIQRKIGMNWAPPPLESTGDLKETTVSFVLLANGRLMEITIEKSSGNAFFDQAALRAVYRANPLPPLPQGMRERSLKVHFNFSLMKKS